MPSNFMAYFHDATEVDVKPAQVTGLTVHVSLGAPRMDGSLLLSDAAARALRDGLNKVLGVSDDGAPF